MPAFKLFRSKKELSNAEPCLRARFPLPQRYGHGSLSARREKQRSALSSRLDLFREKVLSRRSGIFTCLRGRLSLSAGKYGQPGRR